MLFRKRDSGARWISTMLLLLSGLMTNALAQINITPVERAAYTEAMRVTNPQAKVTALEKFLTDYPESQLAIQVHLGMFNTLMRLSPPPKDKLTSTIRKITEIVPQPNRVRIYADLATALLNADILLEDAAKLANDGLAALRDELPSGASRRPFAPYHALLGRIYLRQGKLKEAEASLKEAIAANPRFPAVFIGLAEIAQKKNDDNTALDHLMSAAVVGRIPSGPRKKLEELFARLRSKDSRDLESLLDEKYAKLHPLPFHPDEYKPGQKRTTRTVLAEVFTGAGCGPCVAADLAFDLMLERYKREELVVLMYHLHVPQPDPMTNSDTQKRGRYYGLLGVPGYALDGKFGGGGGTRDAIRTFYNRLNPIVESQLETEAGASLKVEARLENRQVKAKATISHLKTEPTGLRLHIVLAEDHLRYMGENGIRFHPMVVRSLAGENAAGIALSAASPGTVEWNFDLTKISTDIKAHLDKLEIDGFRGEQYAFSEKKDKIDVSNLAVVAFLQDEKSKTVLQSAFIKVKPAAESK